MSMSTIILGIIAFAVVTAIVYVWGLMKAMKQENILEQRLMIKCSKKIEKYIDKHGRVEALEIKYIIDGEKVGIIYSKGRLGVEDAEKFSTILIDYMIEKDIIVRKGDSYVRKN